MAKMPPPPETAANSLASGANNNAAKYVTNAGAASARWLTEATRDPAAWRNGVSAPGAAERQQRNLRSAGAVAFQTGVEGKGSRNYATGVEAGKAKYVRNVAPYFQLIGATAIPMKQLRGSPGNNQRTVLLNNALHARRVGTAAAS